MPIDVPLSGSGALAAQLVGQRQRINVALGSSGALSVDASIVVVAEMRLEVLDSELRQAPTAVTVMVLQGWPEAPVDIAIDGTVIYSDALDSEGNLGPISLNVDETIGTLGSHTVTATATGGGLSVAASGTFTLDREPGPIPQAVGFDADPVDVPGAVTATGVRRWILQDLMPGGLGSWIMPANPRTAAPMPFKRTLTQERSTAIVGSYHVTEAGAEAHEWEFSGFLDTQEVHDKLLAYYGLKRRFYLIDDRGRAWTVAFTGVDMVARKRIGRDDGTFNDWAHDYTVRALVYTSTWKEPV